MFNPNLILFQRIQCNFTFLPRLSVNCFWTLRTYTHIHPITFNIRAMRLATVLTVLLVLVVCPDVSDILILWLKFLHRHSPVWQMKQPTHQIKPKVDTPIIQQDGHVHPRDTMFDLRCNIKQHHFAHSNTTNFHLRNWQRIRKFQKIFVPLLLLSLHIMGRFYEYVNLENTNWPVYATIAVKLCLNL